MDGQIGRQMEGLMGGWTDKKMEKPLRFAICNKKLAVFYINFIFFSLQNRTVFHLLHKNLIPERKQGHRHKSRALIRENVKTCENL